MRALAQVRPRVCACVGVCRAAIVSEWIQVINVGTPLTGEATFWAGEFQAIAWRAVLAALRNAPLQRAPRLEPASCRDEWQSASDVRSMANFPRARSSNTCRHVSRCFPAARPAPPPPP